ncbi:MAG: dual specificity protein phosphatase family protein [Deltaproteobacteria bacterium]|nr:dual specificity protein phosphatase family protein [Deltaproteobacteria bacterium]
MISRFHLVEPGLWVGSCPTGAESSRALAAAGVGAVLSLQTDDDLRALGLRWEVIWGAHVAAGLAVARVPIRDFDKRHLAASVEDALAALEELAEGGRGVFVHCTAGLNRSTTIVIAALAARHDITLDEAARRLMAAHPDAFPYVDALERWWKRRGR